MTDFNVINKSIPRIDAYEKVKGKLKFSADLKMPGMLHARPVYAAHPHARILSIETGEAYIPGVRYIATAKDIPGEKTIGEVIQDQYVLVTDKTRYLGDVIAVVAAETEEIARQAAGLVKVEYERLPVLDSPAKALESAVPVHEQYPDNICPMSTHKVRKGDIEAGFAQADVIIERDYETHFIEHAYIEPEAVVAIPGPKEKEISIYGSVQNPYAVRRSLVRTLNIPMTKARVVQQAIGGTFGGKLETMEAISVRAALLALLTGRPVKMVYDREDSIRESHKRHPFQMKYKIGATKDGKITAIQAQIVADSGPYACMTPFVTWRASVQGCGPYNVENIWLDIKGVYTNNPYTGSMRGFGSPQVVFAVESIVTELAEELNISPYKIREINALKTGDYSPTGHHLKRHVVSVREVLAKAAEEIDFEAKWQQYRKPQTGHLRRGVGLAVSLRGVSLGAEGLDVGRGTVSVEEDGSVFVATGLTEHGQGLRTAMSQIVAETLGIKLDRVHYLDTDTSRSPDSGSTVASRGTTLGGNALIRACNEVKELLAKAVAEQYEVPAGGIRFKDDEVSWEGQSISFEEAVRCCYARGWTPAAVGTWTAPPVIWDEEEGKGEAYFTYVYACQSAEVEVDMHTGKVEVLKVAAAHDVGRAINRQGVEGQIIGGVVMAMGYALTEDLGVEKAAIKHQNFDEYLLPTALDVHQVVPIIVENPDVDGPYGAKSIGEPSTELGAAAIINAVNQATGLKIRQLPASLERVLLGQTLEKDTGRGSELAYD